MNWCMVVLIKPC